MVVQTTNLVGVNWGTRDAITASVQSHCPLVNQL